jgi:hypothetical protein
MILRLFLQDGSLLGRKMCKQINSSSDVGKLHVSVGVVADFEAD